MFGMVYGESEFGDVAADAEVIVVGGILVMGDGADCGDLVIEDHVALQIYGGTSVFGVNRDTGKSFTVSGGVASGLLIESGGFYRAGAGNLIEDSDITGYRESAGGDSNYSQSVLSICSGASASGVRLAGGAVLIIDGAFSLDNVVMDDTVTVVWTFFDSGCKLSGTVLNGFDDFSWEADTKTLTGWVFNGMGKNLFSLNREVHYVNVTINDVTSGFVVRSELDHPIDGMVIDINGAVPGTASSAPGVKDYDRMIYLQSEITINGLKIFGGSVCIDGNIYGLTLENHYSGYSCDLVADGGRIKNAAVASNCVLYVDDAQVEDVAIAGGTIFISQGSVRGVSIDDGGAMYVGDSQGWFGCAESVELNRGTVYLEKGRLNDIVVNSGGTVYLEEGDLYGVAVNSGGTVYAGNSERLGRANIRDVTMSGGVFRFEGSGELCDVGIGSGSELHIGNVTDYFWGEEIRGYHVTMSGGVIYLHRGTLDDVSISGGGVLHVGGSDSRESANLNFVRLDGGAIYLDTGSARDITVGSGGELHIGTLSDSWREVRNNCSAEMVRLNGGTIYVNGGSLRDITVQSGTMYFYGGSWEDAAIGGCTLHIGSGDAYEGRSAVVRKVTASGGTIYLDNGSIDMLNATDETVVIGSGCRDNGSYGISGGTLSGCLVSGVDRCEIKPGGTLVLDGSCSIYAKIRGTGSLVLHGVGNNLYGDQSVYDFEGMDKVRVDATGLWFNEAVMVGGCQLNCLHRGVFDFNCNLGQNDYYIGTADDWSFQSITLIIHTGGYDFPLAMSRDFGDITVGGFRFKLSMDGSRGIHLSVRAVAAQSLLVWDAGWGGSAEFAPVYVTNLEDTFSGTVILGAGSEGSGGNRIVNAFGEDMTGGLIGSGINSSEIYGGGSGGTLATTWVKVEGGTRNGIYGGGIGDTVTDGTNVYIGGSATTTAVVFGGGAGSQIFVGAHNIYAVKMELAGGRHHYVYGGGSGGTIDGDVEFSAHDCMIYNLYSGAGNSSVNGNVMTTLNLPEYMGYKMTGNFYGGAVASVEESSSRLDTAVSGNIVMTLQAGDFQGIVYGGSRAWGTKAAIAGSITLNVQRITSSDNMKMRKYGSTAWVIGGSQVAAAATVGGTGTIAGSVVVNLGASELVNVVGGGQAVGAGSRLGVSSVVINIEGTSVADCVYGGGYAADGGRIDVGSVRINIIGLEDSVTMVGGTVFAAGRTFGANAGVEVSGDVVVTLSGRAENISIGMVDAFGKGGCAVDGGRNLEFSSLVGELGGNFVKFDKAVFRGETRLSLLGCQVETSDWYFDAWNRREAMPFVQDSESFNLVGDWRMVDLSFAVESDVSFDLMDVSDEDLDGVTVRFLNRAGVELGRCEFGGTIALSGGSVSLAVDQRGILVASYTAGSLA